MIIYRYMCPVFDSAPSVEKEIEVSEREAQDREMIEQYT